MPVGLASLVIMTQVYFTILFAVVFFGERPTRAQTIGAMVSLVGLGVIGFARSGHANFLPFLLTLGAALCWGAGNIVGKRIGRVDPIALVVWSSLVAPAPMLALSCWVAPERTISSILHPTLTLALSVAGLAYGGTLISYGLWSRLLARHPAAAVTPFALLVPVVGDDLGAGAVQRSDERDRVAGGGAGDGGIGHQRGGRAGWGLGVC